MITVVELKGETSTNDTRYVALNLRRYPAYVIGTLDKEGMDIVSCCDDEDMQALHEMFFDQWIFKQDVALTSNAGTEVLEDFLHSLVNNKKVKVKGIITKVIDEMTGKTNTVICDGAKSVLKMLSNYTDNGMAITLTKKNV